MKICYYLHEHLTADKGHGWLPSALTARIKEEVHEHLERGIKMAEKTYKFVCTVCGYEVEVDTPELPEDYVCPVCGVGPEMFELVEE